MLQRFFARKKHSVEMVNIKFLLLFPLLSTACWATDLKPWFETDPEVEIRASLLYQNFNSIATPHHSRRYQGQDAFMTLSAEYPFKRYCGEFEATAAYTRHQKGRWDNFRFTGRYQWMNEMDGDSFSLTTGVTITEPLSRALHDISSFHHGHIEFEMHLSLGKQYGLHCKDYLYRWWSVLSFGIADVGSYWIRGDAAYEYKYADVHHFRGFLTALGGGGQNNLHVRCFHGYGCIKHRSVDVGMRYSYSMGFWGTLSLQYARRVYAYNFPENANLVTFEYKVPFGTQYTYNY